MGDPIEKWVAGIVAFHSQLDAYLCAASWHCSIYKISGGEGNEQQYN